MEDVGAGTFEARLSSWKYFGEFLTKYVRTFAGVTVWRGHADAEWKLEPTLDRLLRQAGSLGDPDARVRHLENFRRATRGRRGAHPTPLVDEDEWWALGQHFGLATPLLDWTLSPYVALYFAFASSIPEDVEYRAVWALQRLKVTALARSRLEMGLVPSKRLEISFVEPLSDENSRLVNQGGLFTKGPEGLPLDEWLTSLVPEPNSVLARIMIPNKDRDDCLLALNDMNINHLSLFPDLYGASKYCNQALAVADYCFRPGPRSVVL
jgi:hypothetical protein